MRAREPRLFAQHDPQVEGNREFNPGWHTAIDLQNLMIVSEAITLCALERQESRGGHFREDFQKKDETTWGKCNLVVKRAADGSMSLSRRPTVPLPAELAQVVEENK